MDVARGGKLEDHLEVFAAGHAIERDGVGEVPLAQPDVARELEEPLGVQPEGERQPLRPPRLAAAATRQLHEGGHRVLGARKQVPEFKANNTANKVSF